MNSPNKPVLMAKLMLELREENQELLGLLARYGDHTLECYYAKTHKCVCGWDRVMRERKIKPR